MKGPNRVNILHLYKDYFPVLGGIENHLRILAEGQAARGHSVTVLVTSRTGQTHVDERAGVRIIFAGQLATVASTPLSLALPLRLRRERPDIAHLHFPYPLGDLAQTVFGRARRTVISYHSDIVRQKRLLRLYAPLLRRSLARADGILAASPRYVETSPFLAPLAARCTIIPYGIEAERFAAADPAQVELLRAQYGPRIILFVGQLRYYKGLEYLLAAMRQVEARLLVAGGDDPRRRAELEALARSLGTAERVSFLGQPDDDALPALYQACDVFTLPASERSEAFGLVQLEAMAAGRPVVSCDVGTGVAWVNQDGLTGLVTPPRDAQKLAEALNRLLADPGLRARMGAAGQERVRQNFGQGQMLEQIEAFYGRVLNAPDRNLIVD